MRREHLEAIADVLKDTQVMVLSDEIYSELTYGNQPHITFAAIDGMKERTIVVLSLIHISILPILATASILMPVLVEPILTEEQTCSVTFKASGILSIKA